MRKLVPLTLAACLLAAALTGCGDPDWGGVPAAKPVIYLYPEEETQVSVRLDFDGELTSTYPSYEDGWTVDASPDGTLTDPATGRSTTACSGRGSARRSTTFPPASAWLGKTPLPFWRMLWQTWA